MLFTVCEGLEVDLIVTIITRVVVYVWSLVLCLIGASQVTNTQILQVSDEFAY